MTSLGPEGAPNSFPSSTDYGSCIIKQYQLKYPSHHSKDDEQYSDNEEDSSHHIALSINIVISKYTN